MFNHDDMIPLTDFPNLKKEKKNGSNIITQSLRNVPITRVENMLEHLQNIIYTLEQLNPYKIQYFLKTLLYYMNTPEFGNLLNEIFNDNDMKHKILDIYEKVVTSVRKKNSVANAYLKEMNPLVHRMVTNWLGFGKIKKNTTDIIVL